MNRRDVLSLAGAAFAAAALAPLRGAAQGTYQARYPERPIKLMVAFSAGGVNDMVARQWADRVKEFLGTVVVENQGGGGGTLGPRRSRAQQPTATRCCRQRQQLVVNPDGQASRRTSDQRLRADRHQRGDGAGRHGECVAADPHRPRVDLVAYAKANPGKLTYGSAGNGTGATSGELFNVVTGINDPYSLQGRRPRHHRPRQRAYSDDDAKRDRAGAGELHRAGKVRILAVNGAQRLAAAPDIPTAIQEGVPGHDRRAVPRPVCPSHHAQGDRRSDHGGHARKGDDGTRSFKRC